MLPTSGRSALSLLQPSLISDPLNIISTSLFLHLDLQLRYRLHKHVSLMPEQSIIELMPRDVELFRPQRTDSWMRASATATPRLQGHCREPRTSDRYLVLKLFTYTVSDFQEIQV